jgi:hypothetical protein
MAAPAGAQTTPTTPLTVLPPPSINDPGAKPVPANDQAKSTGTAPSASSARPAPATSAIPIPALPGGHSGASRDARGEPAPTVRVRKHEGKIIEEYYEGGQLYMVRVHPKHGVPYSYVVSKGHKLNRSPGAPPVNPALYKVLEWGKPPPPPENSH